MIKTVVQMGDIHIRKLHRFREYREVFNRLYVQLRKINPDLIVVCGDVVHGKLDTSPELTRMVSELFLELCNISHTIVIPGNHDVNLNNKSREDVLSPIVDLVKEITPKIHYWKDSGKYTIDNIDFGVLSIFDIDKNGRQLINKLPNPKDLNNEYKIALHHGQVGSFMLDNGFIMNNDNVNINTFSGYNIVMLGDIHFRQSLDKNNKIVYAGSCIQQNFAEDTSKGFLVWDLEQGISTFHEIKNDYGFKTLEVVSGNIKSDMDYIPHKGNVRIKYIDTTFEQLKNIQTNLRKKYPKLKDIRTEKQDTLTKLNKGIIQKKIDIGNIRSVGHQNELIEDFLTKYVDDVSKETIKRVQELNNKTNNSSEIYSENDITRNVDWKLKSFEFSNMFSYGEDNKIDFEKFEGVMGLIAPNASGKSSIFDGISYTIFDKCSRSFKSIDVLNKRKNGFTSKIHFMTGGVDYYIERKGILNERLDKKTGKVNRTCPVKVNFYMIDNGNKIDLTGAARRNTQYGSGTDEQIRRVLGTFNDFILTSLSLQSGGMNFIDKKQTERKHILSKFLDLDVFDKLYELAKMDSNEERILLKNFKKKDTFTELSNIEIKIDKMKVEKNELSIELKSLNNEIDIFTDKKVKLSKKIHIIGDILDIEILNKSLKDKKNDKLTIISVLGEKSEVKEKLRTLYNSKYDNLSKFNEKTINSNYKEYEDLKSKQIESDINLRNINNQINFTKDMLKELEKYKYDDECKYCLENGKEHIQHKKKTEKELEIFVNKRDNIDKLLININHRLKELRNVKKHKDELSILTEEIDKISTNATDVNAKINLYDEKLKTVDAKIDNINMQIKRYYEIESYILENKKTSNKILDVDGKITKVTNKRDNIYNEYTKLISNISILENDKSQLEKIIQKIVDSEQLVGDYNLYLMALSKDGISYEIISKVISVIEDEVNNVLDNMMVDFTIKLEMNGKNIDAFICYNNECWSLELSSGMERFVSGLAIRIGLINISTLPRPSFFILDEGMGSLDGDNIANMDGVFKYLKSQFEFIMIITHIDAVKDYMDKTISIDKINGFSKVMYV